MSDTFDNEDIKVEVDHDFSYDIGSFFSARGVKAKTKQEETEDESVQNTRKYLSQLMQMQEFFDSQAGQLFKDKILAIQNEKMTQFLEAKDKELLSVQSDFKAILSIKDVVINVKPEIDYLKSTLPKTHNE